MTGLLTTCVLTLLQLIAGAGILNLLAIRIKPLLFISLSILLGIGVFSAIPFLLQLMYIPITAVNIFSSISITCLALNVRSLKAIRLLKEQWQGSKFRVRLYEIPFLVLVSFIVMVSVWRCFYYPPTPRDLTSGAEVIAEYTVKEKTMVNSLFTVNLETTNNQFKPPFITSLQVIYKYAGFPFGQVWLSGIFVCFIVFLYQAAALKVHRLIAWLLVLFFLAIPEMYAYTFMVLFDYSNAVFFAVSAYLLVEYFKRKKNNYLLASSVGMAVATYIRSETLLLAFFFLPMLLNYSLKYHLGFKKTMYITLVFLLPVLFTYLVSVSFYISYYLPVKYQVEGLINTSLSDLRPLLRRFIGVNRKLIFSETGIRYYGYYYFIFLAVLFADLFFIRHWTNEAKNWLFAVAVIFLGLPLIGFLLPLMDIDNSTKRGMFKIFPLMLLYMANSAVVVKLSEKIKSWQGW